MDDAAALGVDAVILADIGLLAYAMNHHPQLRRHLSVQAAASNPSAIAFYQETFGISRIVLPRVLSIDEIQRLVPQIGSVEAEVFVFGGLCPMTEGRCSLSSYATGKSPNMSGVCSPASHVAYEETPNGLQSLLGGFTINRFDSSSAAGYPTLCKGRFQAGGQLSYLFEDPVSLNIMAHLDALHKAGVKALKIEGRQRGREYVRKVVRTFRTALDEYAAQGKASSETLSLLDGFTEGGQNTSGAYQKTWK